MNSRYNVVFFDTVGMPYTGETPEHSGLGGSEFEAILVAEGLAARGLRVLVLNNTPNAMRHRDVDYAPNSQIPDDAQQCDVLILQRYSTLPPIHAAKILISASDVPGNFYNHLDELATSDADVTLVAVSEWQKNLFPANWRKTVVPNMLPDTVYHIRKPVNPRKFVYASAALKGLNETLDAWKEITAGGNPQKLELCVCTPGYDSVDADALAAVGVRFLGSLPFARVVDEIAEAAGLFYVNAFAETFCIVAALAEALGRRTHILCAGELAALPTTVNSHLVTTDRDAFLRDFRAALAMPDDARWYRPANDFRVGTLIDCWIALLKAPPQQKPKPRAPVICLSMIVKNEAHVIERCLRSVKPFVNAWAICDTGSTDGTQDIIRRFMADLPGELVERPWIDFATNRNEALDLARKFGDHALVIDADDVLETDAGFAWPELGALAYMIEIVDANDTRYGRVALPRLDANWKWQGVLHEALCTPQPVSTPYLRGLRILRIFNDGARSRQTAHEKFSRDADILRRVLIKEPANARYAFYLAQSLRDAGFPAEALAAYEKRVAMGGWAEEVYFSKLQIATLLERTTASYAQIVAAWIDAYDYRPTRAEAPCELARYLRLQQRYTAAREFGRIACAIPKPDDVLFLDESVYAWRARDELSISAYWSGDRPLSAKLCRELLADPRLPAAHRERVQKNLEFSEPQS